MTICSLYHVFVPTWYQYILHWAPRKLAQFMPQDWQSEHPMHKYIHNLSEKVLAVFSQPKILVIFCLGGNTVNNWTCLPCGKRTAGNFSLRKANWPTCQSNMNAYYIWLSTHENKACQWYQILSGCAIFICTLTWQLNTQNKSVVGNV